jgi:hypothetical protein
MWRIDFQLQVTVSIEFRVPTVPSWRVVPWRPVALQRRSFRSSYRSWNSVTARSGVQRTGSAVFLHISFRSYEHNFTAKPQMIIGQSASSSCSRNAVDKPGSNMSRLTGYHDRCFRRFHQSRQAYFVVLSQHLSRAVVFNLFLTTCYSLQAKKMRHRLKCINIRG